MEEASKCLKPGGLAIFIDFDLEFLYSDMVTILPMAMIDSETQTDGSVGGGTGFREEASAEPQGTNGSWLQRICYGAQLHELGFNRQANSHLSFRAAIRESVGW